MKKKTFSENLKSTVGSQYTFFVKKYVKFELFIVLLKHASYR